MKMFRIILFVTFNLIFINTQASKLYKSRFFYYNKLRFVYGKPSEAILKDILKTNAYIFGGPCNPYEHSLTDKESLYECNKGVHEFKAPLHTKESTIKLYKLSSLCTKLSSLREITKYKDNKKLWEKLFYKYYPLDEAPQFETIYNKTASNFEISYSLCMSEKWQTL